MYHKNLFCPFIKGLYTQDVSFFSAQNIIYRFAQNIFFELLIRHKYLHAECDYHVTYHAASVGLVDALIPTDCAERTTHPSPATTSATLADKLILSLTNETETIKPTISKVTWQKKKSTMSWAS